MLSNIQKKLDHIDEIPTLPTVAIEIISLAQSANVQMNKLSEVIHRDPPLAAKVLRAANSAYYRRSDVEVETIQRAILMLGLNEIVNLTSSISVFSAFPTAGQDAQSLRYAFWNHCVATGIIAKYMAKKFDLPTSGQEFVGGLLHDIGKIVLDEFFHEDFVQAHDFAVERGLDLIVAEREILGTDHAEVGAILADRWRLPSYLKDVIAFHHVPAQATAKEVTAVVSIANQLAKSLELSCGGGTMGFVLSELEGWQLLKQLGHPMDDIDIERLTFELGDMRQEVASYISSFGAGGG